MRWCSVAVISGRYLIVWQQKVEKQTVAHSQQSVDVPFVGCRYRKISVVHNPFFPILHLLECFLSDTRLNYVLFRQMWLARWSILAILLSAVSSAFILLGMLQAILEVSRRLIEIHRFNGQASPKWLGKNHHAGMVVQRELHPFWQHNNNHRHSIRGLSVAITNRVSLKRKDGFDRRL